MQVVKGRGHACVAPPRTRTSTLLSRCLENLAEERCERETAGEKIGAETDLLMCSARRINPEQGHECNSRGSTLSPAQLLRRMMVTERGAPRELGGRTPASARCCAGKASCIATSASASFSALPWHDDVMLRGKACVGGPTACQRQRKSCAASSGVRRRHKFPP